MKANNNKNNNNNNNNNVLFGNHNEMFANNVNDIFNMFKN
jgi:hypothetical protein